MKLVLSVKYLLDIVVNISSLKRTSVLTVLSFNFKWIYCDGKQLCRKSNDQRRHCKELKHVVKDDMYMRRVQTRL